MSDTKKRLISLTLTLVLTAANLIALNYLVSGWSAARLDLTEENLFSISTATRRILANLDEDVTIHAYFSRRTHPKLAPLVPEVLDLLDEYRAVSRGRVRVEVIEPEKDEAAIEEAADRFGVRSTPFRLASKYESGIVNAFFSLVIRYADHYERYGFDDLIEVEPLPDGDIDVRLRNLEYDLTRAIKKVVFGFRSTAELFERVGRPVKLTAIISPDSLPEIFAEVPDAVRKAAEELEEKGGELFTFEEIDPTRDPALLQQVEAFGLRPMALGLLDDRQFYLYGILEAGDTQEQLALTAETATAASIREAIEASLRRQTPGFLATVGLVVPDPPQIPPQLQMQYQMPPQPPPEFQDVGRFLERDYGVRKVALDAAGGVPADVDVLLVIKPQALSPDAVYALDQYLMRGGRVILCSGNYETDLGAAGLDVRPVDSGLGDWLAHHGVSIDSSLVLDDRNQALPIPEVRQTMLGNLRTWSLAPYPYLVQVREDGFLNPDVTASLDSVGIYWGSPLSVNEEEREGREVLPILQSSDLSWTSNDLAGVQYVDYEVPAEGTRPHLLAVALVGRFSSYFENRPVPTDGTPGEDEAGAAPARVPLMQSPETRLVVVGNAEFLSDFVARSLGRLDGGFFVENLRFVENLIDWVGLDNDMLEIRSRGMASRRLNRTDKTTQVTVETLNYIVPFVLLGALGVWLVWNRRHAVPLIPTRPIAAPSAGRSAGKEAGA